MATGALAVEVAEVTTTSLADSEVVVVVATALAHYQNSSHGSWSNGGGGQGGRSGFEGASAASSKTATTRMRSYSLASSMRSISETLPADHPAHRHGKNGKAKVAATTVEEGTEIGEKTAATFHVKSKACWEAENFLHSNLQSLNGVHIANGATEGAQNEGAPRMNIAACASRLAEAAKKAATKNA